MAKYSSAVLIGTAIFISTVFFASTGSAQFDWTIVGDLPLVGHDPVHANPYGLALHPDPAAGLAYVALAGEVAPAGEPASLYSGRFIVEFGVDTLAVVRTFEVGFFPTELAVSPDGAELYATTSTESTLFRIDLASGVVTPLPITGSIGDPIAFLSGVEFSPDGTEIWVASNGGSFDGSSENFIIVDRGSGLVTDRLVIPGGLSRFAVRADGRVVLPVGFPGDDFTAAPEIRIYDSSNWTLIATLPVPVDTADFPAPSDIVLSADSGRAYLTIFGGAAEVIVVDVDSATLLPPLILGGADFVQTAVALTSDGATLAVADFFGGRVRAIDRITGALESELFGLALPNSMIPVAGRLFVTEQGLERIAVIALPGAFLRGDPNRDGTVNLADGIAILQYLFSGGALACADAGDLDDGGAIDVADAVAVFAYLFQGGTSPSAPFPLAGGDSPSSDPYDCNP